MEALAGLYASDGGESDGDWDAREEDGGSGGGSTHRVAVHGSPVMVPGRKRTRPDDDGGAGEEECGRRHGGEDRAARRTSLLIESLWLLQRDPARWPSASLAAERKRVLAWFSGLCESEFAQELAADAGVMGGAAAGLHVFGSEVCSMWVPASDIDCNMWTRERIPQFFVRLKRAIMAADAAAHFELIAGARVPVAKIRVRALQFDVTHECGADNSIAVHQRQIREWAQRWSQDAAVTIAIRVIKLWAAAKKLNNPSRATLNSLGFLVMLLALPAANISGTLAHPHPSGSTAASAHECAALEAIWNTGQGTRRTEAAVESSRDDTYRAVQVLLCIIFAITLFASCKPASGRIESIFNSNKPYILKGSIKPRHGPKP
jgi:hypothetical protein